MINFYKYQGAGNDFILIDNRNDLFLLDKIEFAKKICCRRFGVGSDGVIFIENHHSFDFEMDFFNPDGSKSFCGNGSRCAVAFAKYLAVFSENKTVFEAIDGRHEAEILGRQVKVNMNPVKTIEKIKNDYFLNTGSPHYIKYVNDFSELDIVEYGRSIRYSNQFKVNGTNVNIVKENSALSISIKTYERGVEAETLACGTGATACALSFANNNKLTKGEVEVKAVGGDLKVFFEKESEGFKNIWLQGPAEFVFKGEFEI